MCINIIRNKANASYNVEPWKQGNEGVLFITGLSGSGKTTLAHKLSKETGVPVVSLDGYLKPLLRKKYGTFTTAVYRQLVRDHGVELLLAHHSGTKVIIEGGQIGWMNPLHLKDHAVITLGTSFLCSTLRAMLRDFTKEHWSKYHHIAPHVHLGFNLLTYMPLRNMVYALT